jgi:hypothetical protein
MLFEEIKIAGLFGIENRNIVFEGVHRSFKFIILTFIQLRLDYESYRLGFRDVTASTNERTMIVTILPKGVVCGNTLRLERVFGDQIIEKELSRPQKVT